MAARVAAASGGCVCAAPSNGGGGDHEQADKLAARTASGSAKRMEIPIRVSAITVPNPGHWGISGPAKGSAGGARRTWGQMPISRRWLRPSGQMPAIIRTMQPTLATAVPREPGWVHELKHDGWRIVARIAGGAVRLTTRTGATTPDAAPAAGGLGVTSARRSAITFGGSTNPPAHSTSGSRCRVEHAAMTVMRTAPLVRQLRR